MLHAAAMSDTSVYPRKGSPKWYVSYWCVKKMKRIHEATPWRIDDPAGRKHALRFAAAKSEEAAAMRGNAKHETWGAWVEKFLSDRFRQQRKTLTRYLNAWDWIRVYLDEKKLPLPAGVDYNHVIKYLDWRTSKKRHCGKMITRNTALTEVKVWGGIMGEAMRRGFATSNPCLRLGLRRDPPREKPEMSNEEVAVIRAELKKREGALPITEQWMTVSFELALHHGCRLSATQIPFSAISLEQSRLTLHEKGKNGQPKIFTVGIHDGVRGLLLRLREAGATVTCRMPAMPSKVWHDFFRGLQLGHLCFHCTRVTVITRMARGGVPIQQAMAYVGHASESVHRIYQRLKPEDLALCRQALNFGSTAGTPQTPGVS